MLAAIEHAQGVGSFISPIKDMEDVSAGALPDLSAFLPLWVKRLERFKASKDEWESDQERWRREAVFRLDGVDGLERLARATKRPQTCLAWCEAMADRGDWVAALRAYGMAAKLVGGPIGAAGFSTEPHSPLKNSADRTCRHGLRPHGAWILRCHASSVGSWLAVMRGRPCA